ncbi:MAG: surface-adhesin E family protein [Betaproteobacteria bacterium]
MKTAKWIVASLLLAATSLISVSAFAGEWSQVANDGKEVVYVDRGSVYEQGDLKKIRVLRSFSTVQTIGDEAFPHKSEILLYAVRCENSSLAFEQWTLTAGEIGTGATVWTGEIDQPSLSLYQDPNDPAAAGLVSAVCKG